MANETMHSVAATQTLFTIETARLFVTDDDYALDANGAHVADMNVPLRGAARCIQAWEEAPSAEKFLQSWEGAARF